MCASTYFKLYGTTELLGILSSEIMRSFNKVFLLLAFAEKLCILFVITVQYVKYWYVTYSRTLNMQDFILKKYLILVSCAQLIVTTCRGHDLDANM